MNPDQSDFETFLQQRVAAADAYTTGNGALLDALVTRENPATFFPPSGALLQGAKDVAERYLRDSGSFAPGSENSIEILQCNASGDCAWWVGLQRSKVMLKGKAEPVPFNLRITELFRKEDGAWKLVHRHADAATK